jgi:hypothetical protein
MEGRPPTVAGRGRPPVTYVAVTRRAGAADRGGAPDPRRVDPSPGRPARGAGPRYAVTCGWRDTSTISCGSVTIVSMMP